MPLTFEASVKGGVTEALTAALLRSVGYRVIPLGIEHSVQELRAIADQNLAAYLDVNEALRKLPDFLVLDLQAQPPWVPSFVEVKFRASHNALQGDRNLQQAVALQAATWGSVYLIVFLGDPFRVDGGNFIDTPTNSCRVFRVIKTGDGAAMLFSLRPGHEGEHIAVADIHWMHGVPLQALFTRLAEAEIAQAETIRRAVGIARAVERAFD